jgi:rhodanese-related sulfurtransferase
MQPILKIVGALVIGGMVSFPAVSEEVKVGESQEFYPLTEDKPYVHVIHDGRAVKIQRVQDPDYELKGYFAKTVRKCPPFCIRPERADPRVETIGEVELFDFIETELRDGNGVLIDARTPSWFQKGTIPGSINIPFTVFTKEAEDPTMVGLIEKFGGVPREEPGAVTRMMEELGWTDSHLLTEKWDFTGAKTLVLWCNGPTCGQSPRAVKGLLNAGYPPEKLRYYRGGMQMWQLFGLTTVVPAADTVAAAETASVSADE